MQHVQKNGGSPAENTAYIKDTFVKEESLGRGQTLSVDSLGKVLSCNIAFACIFQECLGYDIVGFHWCQMVDCSAAVNNSG
jgi:hypothetical protein